MGELNFTVDERQFADRLIRQGLLQDSNTPYWWVMRLALSASLRQESDPDGDAFGRVPYVKGGMELHLAQVVERDGAGNSDLSDAFMLLLSMRHGEDFFGDKTKFIAILNRHLRRGLAHLRSSWREGADFHDYLLDDLYYGAPTGPGATGAGSGAIDRVMIADGLRQIGVSSSFDGDQVEGPRMTRFGLALGSVEDYDRLRRKLDELAFAMGLGESAMTLTRSTGERRVLLDVPRPIALGGRSDGRLSRAPSPVGPRRSRSASAPTSSERPSSLTWRRRRTYSSAAQPAAARASASTRSSFPSSAPPLRRFSSSSIPRTSTSPPTRAAGL